MNADLGYDPHNAMSLPIPVHDNTHMSWQDRSQYFDHLRTRIAAMPQVVQAGISTNATPPSNGSNTKIEIMGRGDAEKPEVLVNLISSEYFSVLHIPLLQGRLWDHPEIMRGAHLAVVNQSMASQFWPNASPIGQQVRVPQLNDPDSYTMTAPGAGDWLQITGVVGDARDEGLRDPIKPALFVPYTLRMYMFTQILVRTSVAPMSLLHDFRAQVVQVDPDQQIIKGARDLEGWITHEDDYGQQRLVATLFGIFSVLALALAAVGLYSVVSYGVATRTSEFGIRMALGARSGDVFRLVLSSTALSVGAGLAAGLALSVAFSKLATKFVTESSRDPLILGGVTLLLVAAAALASFIPARRAASVDPIEALRYE
jgi:putative ABC transport system permease protein